MAYKVCFEKHNNKITGPLILLFKLSRIFGVAPVEFTSSGLKISRSYTTYSRIMIFILSLTILTGFGMDMTAPNTSLRASTTSTALIWICNLTILMSITGIGCIGAPQRLQCIINVLNRIKKAKYKMGTIKQKDPTERVQYVIIFSYTIGIVVLIFVDYYSYFIEAKQHKRNLNPFFIYSMFYIEFVIQVFLELQFSLTVLQLRNILKICNEQLDSILNKINYSILDSNIEINEKNDKENKKISVRRINQAIDTLYENVKEDKVFNEAIRVIALIYEDICNDEQDINRSFGTLIIVILVSFFLYLVVTPYYIITFLHYTSKHAAIILLQTAWLTFHGLNLLLVIEPCHYMEVEVNRTRVLVSHLLRRAHSFSDSLYQELRVFSKILLLNKCNYSPFGMCVLERPLITKILGAVATYLVIIVQFRGGNKEW